MRSENIILGGHDPRPGSAIERAWDMMLPGAAGGLMTSSLSGKITHF
jgi:hypothetical protein